jgi:mono/diheme cytochrome c family protein/rhodanese-related sulfurtransferase
LPATGAGQGGCQNQRCENKAVGHRSPLVRELAGHKNGAGCPNCGIARKPHPKAGLLTVLIWRVSPHPGRAKMPKMALPAAAVVLLVVGLQLCGQPDAARELEAGKEAYVLQCVQCHGDDGDAVSHVDIVPVAGIKRRYPREIIAQLSGAFSGRVLTGKDRQRVVEYMRTLRGAKGYADPGWLITPHTAERKAPRLTEFRLIDTRPKDAYDAGHITNAVWAQPGNCFAAPDETARWLGQLGVTPSTVVVVYDEAGGPSAACAWWRIRRAGHEWVAVLDGGWQRFTAENRLVSRVIPKLHAAAYPAKPRASQTVHSAPPGQLQAWNWEDALTSDGFHASNDLIRLIECAGVRGPGVYRVPGPLEQVAHLVLALHLIGYGAEYNAAASVLAVFPPVEN